MDIIDTLAVQLFAVTSLIVLLLIILTAFVGISDNNRSQTPSYSSEDDLAAYLNGRKEIACIKNKKGFIFDNDTSEMIPDPTSDISEDPKTFIRDKFYIDI